MKILKIFGPPGCGKTYTLLRYLKTELLHYHVSQIAFVSFTRAGVNEGKNRAQEAHHYMKKDCVYFNTLHSICFRESRLGKAQLMGYAHNRIFELQTGIQIIRDEDSTDTDYISLSILERNSAARAANVMRTDSSINNKRYIHAKSAYANYRKQSGVYDFTDLLELYVKIGKPLPVKVAFIDEAQDLTTLQWQVVHKMFENVERLYIAGDDDQAIYQWSGADVDVFLKHPGEETVLDQSHRLPKSVLQAALKVSARIKNRKDKQFVSTQQEGEVKFMSSREAITDYLDDDTLILSRNNLYLSDAKAVLQRSGVRYTIDGEDAVPDVVLNAVRRYETYRKTGTGLDSLAAYEKYFTTVLDREKPWYDVLKKEPGYINYIRALFRYKTADKPATTRLSTIHAIKGGEAKTVILLLDVSAAVARNMLLDPDSELRVLYVGITRAKQRLIIGLSQTRFSFAL